MLLAGGKLAEKHIDMGMNRANATHGILGTILLQLQGKLFKGKE